MICAFYCAKCRPTSRPFHRRLAAPRGPEAGCRQFVVKSTFQPHSRSVVPTHSTELFRLIDQRNHAPQRLHLSRNIVGPTHRRPNIQLPNHLPRRPCKRSQRLHHRNQHRRHARLFEATRDQTHGLMTDGSRWHQQHGIDVIRQQRLHEIRNQLIDQRPHIGLQAHDHVRVVGDGSDLS